MTLTYRIRLIVARYPGETATMIAQMLGEQGSAAVASTLWRLAVKEQSLRREKNARGTWIYFERIYA